MALDRGMEKMTILDIGGGWSTDKVNMGHE